ncbi:MAG: rod shape-determining protein MreD [Elusimicrobiota bacterium]
MRYLGGAFVFFVGILAHWLWSTYFPLFGLAPQVLLILTIAVASSSGPVAGQCFGFAWGLFLDVLSAHVFGANALGLTLVGYFIGMLRRQMDVASAPSQIVFVMVLTPAYLLFLGFAGLVFERTFLWVGWKAFLADPLYNSLVCPFGFAFVRRSMRL